MRWQGTGRKGSNEMVMKRWRREMIRERVRKKECGNGSGGRRKRKMESEKRSEEGRRGSGWLIE